MIRVILTQRPDLDRISFRESLILPSPGARDGWEDERSWEWGWCRSFKRKTTFKLACTNPWGHILSTSHMLRRSASLPTCLLAYLAVYLPTWLSVCPSVYVWVCLSQSVTLSLCLLVCLPLCRLCLSLSVYRQSISLLPLLINLVFADDVSHW